MLKRKDISLIERKKLIEKRCYLFNQHSKSKALFVTWNNLNKERRTPILQTKHKSWIKLENHSEEKMFWTYNLKDIEVNNFHDIDVHFTVQNIRKDHFYLTFFDQNENVIYRLFSFEQIGIHHCITSLKDYLSGEMPKISKMQICLNPKSEIYLSEIYLRTFNQPQSSKIIVFSDKWTYSGIYAFTQEWIKFFEPETIQLTDPNNMIWTSNSELLIYEYHHCISKTNSEILQKSLDAFPNHKKVFFVHEINGEAEFYLRQANFLVFFNQYQKSIATKFLNLSSIPSLCLQTLPRHEIEIEIKKEPWIYLGGIYKKNKGDLLSHIKTLLKDFNESDVKIFLNMPRYDAHEEFEKDIDDIQKSKNLKDKVIIKLEPFETYNEMLQAMMKCTWVYLYRNDLDLTELENLIENHDNSVLEHTIGESGMLRDAYLSKCIPIVNPSSRFAAYWNKANSISLLDFTNYLKKIIKSLTS